MPKAAPFAPKPAIEKLPLAVRKDNTYTIRDNYESEKDELEATISELLGTTFHININVNEVWAYNPPDYNTSVGGLGSNGWPPHRFLHLTRILSIYDSYVKGFVDALKWYIEKYGDEGKTHFNEAVTQSELTVTVNELGDKASRVWGSALELVKLNVRNSIHNQSYINDYLLKAIENVPRAGFSIVAKFSIEEYYNAEIEKLTTEIGEILAIPDVVLDPNFEAKSPSSISGNTLTHHQLNSQGFKGDDMLQEGLAEIVNSKTFQIRIVKKTKNDATIETVVENGTVYIQMTAQKWRYNVSEAGAGLIELL
ncbi:hypothetical protein H0H87_000632 [Tephrocybe sp. NHM501043]|nr:hypothetical protein H0H87_000632 [Tephrocybe sp. NHM501043]